MPIYEYQCRACGHQLEAFQKMSDAPLSECPVCQKETLGKLVSATSFQLKGTGWYATDFRNKGEPPAKKEETSGESGGTEKSTSEKSTTTNNDSTVA